MRRTSPPRRARIKPLLPQSERLKGFSWRADPPGPHPYDWDPTSIAQNGPVSASTDSVRAGVGLVLDEKVSVLAPSSCAHDDSHVDVQDVAGVERSVSMASRCSWKSNRRPRTSPSEIEGRAGPPSVPPATSVEILCKNLQRKESMENAIGKEDSRRKLRKIPGKPPETIDNALAKLRRPDTTVRKMMLYSNPRPLPASATVVFGGMVMKVVTTQDGRNWVVERTVKESSTRAPSEQETHRPNDRPTSRGNSARVSCVAEVGCDISPSFSIATFAETPCRPLSDGRPSVYAVVSHATPSVMMENTTTEVFSAQSKSRFTWIAVFNKLRDESEIHKDMLGKALELCGVDAPNPVWVDQVQANITMYSTMSVDEFIMLVQGYFTKRREMLKQIFDGFDKDTSGLINANQLYEIIAAAGKVPLHHALEDVLGEVDTLGYGRYNAEDVRHIAQVLWSREGFTKELYNKFVDAFAAFDREQTGDLESDKFASVLHWLSFPFNREDIDKIVQEVDIDRSGKISQREFMICMRKVRDREFAILAEQADTHSLDRNGVLNKTAVAAYMHALGYALFDLDAFWEAAAEDGVKKDEDNLSIEQMWRLVCLYRAREGQSDARTAEAHDVFIRYDKEMIDEISVVDCGKSIRDLGYKIPFEIQECCISRVDVNESGRMNLRAFSKTIRMLREYEVEQLTDAWTSVIDAGALMSKNQVERILHKLPMVGTAEFELFPNELVNSSAKCEFVNLEGFIKVGQRLSQDARLKSKENGGFTELEITHLKVSFAQYDADASGDISNKELICLIEDAFPKIAKDPALRPQLLEILRDADTDGNGSLDFPDFLRLMKQCREMQERERLAKEMQIVAETGHSPQEVVEFRDLFQCATEGYPEITLLGAIQMIIQIAPLNEKQKIQFGELFHEISGKYPGGAIRHVADFPDFLRLMRKLVTINFANIRELTKNSGRERPGCTSKKKASFIT